MALLTNVCRLCLVTEDLVWIFDRKFPGIHNNSLKDIIFATSGVEIYHKDMISQKICSKCCQISMKMFQFREQSLKNDKILKNRYAELLKNAKVKLKIPNTDITITTEKVETEKMETKKEIKSDTSNPRYRIHPSVTALFKDNPQIRLPSVCLKSNIAPCVSLEMDAVEKYFRNRKLSIQRFSQLAVKSTRKVAKKKGSAKPISKPKTFEVPKISSVSCSRSVDPLQIVSSRTTVKLGPNKEKTDKILPINIKKFREKSYKIVNVSTIVAQDNSKSSDDSDNSIRRNPIPSKRKLSTDDSCTELEPKKPAFVESLGLTPKMKPNGDFTGTLYVDNNKSVPLFICDICNSVQYNAKDLKRHMLKHLRCQFCKLKFRSMESKTTHIERYCRIKNMMNNLPAVELEKIEFKLEVRREYPEAFSSFPSLPGLELEKRNDCDKYPNEEISTSVELEKKNDSDNNVNYENSTSVESIQKVTENAVPESSDIIEIMSDDEDTTPTLASELSTVVRETLIGSSKEKECSRYPSSHATTHNTGTKVLNKTSAATIVNTPTVSSEIPVANTLSLLASTARNFFQSVNQRNSVPATKSATDMEQNSSSYVVKPEIVIRNSAISDKFDAKATDTNILKDLLIQLGRLQSDGTTQTELPSNDSIIVNKGSRAIELKNLRYLLLIYKIPVHINKGDFKISYKYGVPTIREKKLCLWNDLVAIDLKGFNDNVDAISSRTTACLIPSSESTTTVADSFRSNTAVTIQKPPNVNNEIALVMSSSQTNTYHIISPSSPSVMSCIQTPSIVSTPNSTRITSDPCSVNSISADGGNAAVSTPVSSEVSDTQTSSILSTKNSTNTSEQPVFSTNTMRTDAGQGSVGSPISSGKSCVQPPAVLLKRSSPNISSPSAFSVKNINAIAGNTTTATSTSSGMGCILPSTSISEMSNIQPPNILFNPNSSSISGSSAFSINNINAIAKNSTSGTSTSGTPTSSWIGCTLTPSSNSVRLPTTTSVHQISPTSVNTATKAVTNTHPNIYTSVGNSSAMNVPLIVQDALPNSASLTPISIPPTSISVPPAPIKVPPTPVKVPPTPIIVPPTPISVSPTSIGVPTVPVSAPLTPIIVPPTPVSAPPTKVSAPPTKVSAPPTPVSTPPTPVSIPSTSISAPLTPVSAPLMTVSATLNNSPASPSNVLPDAIVTDANSVPVIGRVGIRVKNLCELT